MYKKLQEAQESKLWKGFYNINGYIVSICGIAVTLVIFAGVIMRYVFKRDFFGSEEIILLFTWWLYFLGGIGASQENSHISADMVDVFCSNKVIVDMTKGIAKALEAIVFFLCTYMSVLLLMTNIQKWPVSTGLKIPYVTAQAPIVIGFFGMAVFAVYWSMFYISKALHDRKNGGEQK